MTMEMPRIRGRSAQCSEGPDIDKWFYEISLWDLYGENQIGNPFLIGPFESQEEAKEAGIKGTRMVAEECQKLSGGEPTGKYLDFKNGGILRPWENNS